MTFQIYSSATAPLESRYALEKTEQDMGYVPDLLGVFAESPALLNAYVAMGDWMKKTSFDTLEREVVLKTAGQMTGCSWCASAGLNSVNDIPHELSRSAEQGRKLDDPRLEALRLYAVSVIENHGRPAEDVKQRFIEAGYGPQQALEIILAAGMMTIASFSAGLAHRVLESRLRH